MHFPINFVIVSLAYEWISNEIVFILTIANHVLREVKWSETAHALNIVCVFVFNIFSGKTWEAKNLRNSFMMFSNTAKSLKSSLAEQRIRLNASEQTDTSRNLGFSVDGSIRNLHMSDFIFGLFFILFLWLTDDRETVSRLDSVQLIASFCCAIINIKKGRQSITDCLQRMKKHFFYLFMELKCKNILRHN